MSGASRKRGLKGRRRTHSTFRILSETMSGLAGNNRLVFRTIKRGAGKRVIPIFGKKGRSISALSDEEREDRLFDYYGEKLYAKVVAAETDLQEADESLTIAVNKVKSVAANIEGHMEGVLSPSEIEIYRDELNKIISVCSNSQLLISGVGKVLDLNSEMTPIQHMEHIGSAIEVDNTLLTKLNGGMKDLSNAIRAIQMHFDGVLSHRNGREDIEILNEAGRAMETASRLAENALTTFEAARTEFEKSGIPIGPLQQHNIDWHEQQIRYDEASENGNPLQQSNEQWHGEQILYDQTMDGSRVPENISPLQMTIGGKDFNQFALATAESYEKKGVPAEEARSIGYATANKVFQIQAIRNGLVPYYLRTGRPEKQAKRMAYDRAVEIYGSTHSRN